MSNIYLKVTIEKSVLEISLFLVQKMCLHVSSFGAQTHLDISECLNFLLPLKKQRSGTKTVRGFSIILILKGLMTF